jgi:hypothetical protein
VTVKQGRELPDVAASFAVRREPTGACYVVDMATQELVFGTFSEQEAHKRCDEMNRDAEDNHE